MQQYRKNLGKVSLTAEGVWDIKSKYNVLSIVYDEHTQHGFISKQPVPIGVDLYNSEYWMPLNVSGYTDSNIIILNKKTSDASIETYTLEEAVKSIASVGRKPGCILGFYNSNANRLDIGGRWEIWQFNSTTVSEWEDLTNWQNIYYNYNQFVGWYRNEERLKINNPYPEVGCYAYVGNVLDEAVVYRCEIKHKWTETVQRAWDYVKIMIDGTVTVGKNGNWYNNGEDTGIPVNVKGDPGLTPFIRYNTSNNKLEYSYDNIKWVECSDYVSTWFRLNNNKLEISKDNFNWNPVSDYIAAWFRWQATAGDTQANNVGRIQMSRDNGKTWTNMSNDFTNNLHISRYIGINESLPTSGITEGTIYAKGPTYSADDINFDNPIYRLWVYAWKGDTLAWQDNGEFTSIAAGIVQETGNSETEVMSQKAVTTKLSELVSKVAITTNSMFTKKAVSLQLYSKKRISLDGSLTDYEHGNIVVHEVNEGVPYRIRGKNIGSSIYLYAFYSSDILSSGSLIKLGDKSDNVAEVTSYNIPVIAPKGSKYIAISYYYNTAVIPEDERLYLYQDCLPDIQESVENLNDVPNRILSLENEIFISVETSVVGEYLENTKLKTNGDLSSSNPFGVYKYNVSEGEKYHLFRSNSVGSTGSLSYAIYSSLEPSSGTVLIKGPEFNDVIDEVIEIPQNAVLLIVGRVTSNIISVSKLEKVSKIDTQNEYIPNFAVELISNDEVTITRRYSEKEDIRVTMKKCGPNSLMQIYSHSFINNSGKLPSFGSANIVKSSGTDWIGPYVIKADNRPGSYNGFTSGWHGYNGDKTGAKTAETESIKILLDERSAEIGNHYCNTIKIIVTNLIQAGNTKAEDGNGVNVLKEIVTYLFKDTKIYVSVHIIALEDVSFLKYYGMQVTGYSQSISYFADNIEVKEWSEDSNKTINKNLQFIICSDSDNRCVKALMDVIGLGMKEYSDTTSYAFVSGNKAYYSLVGSNNKVLTLSKDMQAYWKGYYEFSDDINLV